MPKDARNAPARSRQPSRKQRRKTAKGLTDVDQAILAFDIETSFTWSHQDLAEQFGLTNDAISRIRRLPAYRMAVEAHHADTFAELRRIQAKAIQKLSHHVDSGDRRISLDASKFLSHPVLEVDKARRLQPFKNAGPSTPAAYQDPTVPGQGAQSGPTPPTTPTDGMDSHEVVGLLRGLLLVKGEVSG